MLFRFINFYAQHFPFPARGLKFFLSVCKKTGAYKKRFKKKLPGGIKMFVTPSEHMQQQLFWYGYYDRPLKELMEKLLNSNSIFIDLGANIGYFSLIAAKKCSSGKVIALEPVPGLFQQLRENIALNRLHNIEAYPLAAGEKDDKRPVYISAEDNQGMSSLAKPENYSGESTMIQVIQPDTWMVTRSLPAIHVIKIDVEGFEIPVLKGMQELLGKHRPVIFIEINPETLSYFNQEPKQLLELISGLRYTTFLITKKGLVKAGPSFDIPSQLNALLLPEEKTGEIMAQLERAGPKP